MAAILAAKIRRAPWKPSWTTLITVNGCAVYCAAVRRWPGRQAWKDLLLRGVGFNLGWSARRDERDSEGEPLRRGDVYIANVPYSFHCWG